MPGYTAQYPRADHFILHLSDTHLLAGERALYGSVDSAKLLRQLVDELEASGARPEAIVVTGDLADKGEADAYAALRSILEPAATRIGAELIWVMGNHDDRGTFRTQLLGQVGNDKPVDRVYMVNGLRIITLDSTVPGHHYGLVTDSQLDWLAEELATRAPHGTILAMHHPPIPSVLDLSVSVELRDQGGLAEVIRGSDIRSIIAGHLHYSTFATFAGVPVSVASATCYTQDLTVPVGGTRGRDGAQGFNLVHVYADTVLHSVVPIGTSPALEWVTADETAKILAGKNITILPAVNAHVPAEEDAYPPTREFTAIS